MSSLKWLTALSVLAVGCGQTPEPEFRLVGMYDASAVVGLNPEVEQAYMWQPAVGMEDSCGPAKGPDGIGLYDAELIANRMSPTLAIVLEHSLPVDAFMEQRRLRAMDDADVDEGDAAAVAAFNEAWEAKQAKIRYRPAVTPNEVTLALGIDKGEFVLQPSVLPRNVAVRIDGDETNLRYQQLVRTQLEVEMCMEHKVGRGWAAARGDQLRQAFLLDRPEGETKDRRYFGGQRDPIAPLLGPSDACLIVSETLRATATIVGGKGDGSTDLVPSDVWGAALRDCTSTEGNNQVATRRSPQVPLTITAHGDPQARQRQPRWNDLTIEVGTGERDEDIKVTVTYEDDRLGEEWEPLIMEDEPLFEYTDEVDEDGRKKGGMIDLMAALPHVYPTTGPRYDPDRYVVLLIPNWQLVEGLRRIFDRTCYDEVNRCTCEVTGRDGTFTCRDDYNETCLPSVAARKACQEERSLQNPMRTMVKGELDGVGWVLENPELLFIQVDTLPEEEPDPEDLNPYDDYVNWYNQSCAKLPWPLRCEKDDLLFACEPPDGSAIDGEEPPPNLDFSCAVMGDDEGNTRPMFCEFPVYDEAGEVSGLAEMDCTLGDVNTLRRDSFNKPELTCQASGGQIVYQCANKALKPNLSVVTQGGFQGIQDWGYVAGQKVGRTPVVLPIEEAGTWEQAKEAQRARQHTMFLIMLGALAGFMVYGFRRLPDLWSRTPEERAYYWPGRQSQKEQEEVDPEGVEANASENEG